MNDRIAYLRKSLLHLSREKFGEPIGMSGSEIRNIEEGKTQLKEIMVPLICAHYRVNDSWLRTGEGDPFTEKSLGEELGAIAKNAGLVDPEAAAEFFHKMIDGMTPAQLVLLYTLYKERYDR